MTFRSSKRKVNARKRWKPTLRRKVFSRTSDSQTALEQCDPRFTIKLCCSVAAHTFYVCQSFQTICEASSIINVTQRSFAVFHPVMYVTHRSFAAPAPSIRDFFWLYHIYILYYAGVSIMPPRVSEAKTLRGQ